MDLPKSHAGDAVKQVRHVYSKLEVGQSRYQRCHPAEVPYTQGHYSHRVVDLVHPLDLGSILPAHNPLLPSHHAHHPNTPSGKQENPCPHLHQPP